MILLLGGGRALLMQLAHPKVAEGVAIHSRFRADPLGRLVQTMNTMWSILFDEAARARASLERIERIHRRVHGIVEQEDVAQSGAPYDAQDPDLLLWVHATLVDSALRTFELFVGALPDPDRRRYYEETRRLAALFGVPDSTVPVTLDAFHEYIRARIRSEEIFAGSTARSLAGAILYPRHWLLRAGGPLFAFITTGLLPEELRRAYGLPWGPRKEKALRLLGRLVRGLLPFVPPIFRVVPQARRAERSPHPGREETADRERPALERPAAARENMP